MRINRIIIYALFVGAAFMAGCSGTPIIKSEDILDVEVETIPSRKIKILWHEVYKQNDTFIVSGVLQQFGTGNYGIKADINITVYSPDGKILHEKDIAGIYVPRRNIGDGVKWRKVKARFPGTVSNESKITIKVK